MSETEILKLSVSSHVVRKVKAIRLLKSFEKRGVSPFDRLLAVHTERRRRAWDAWKTTTDDMTRKRKAYSDAKITGAMSGDEWLAMIAEMDKLFPITPHPYLWDDDYYDACADDIVNCYKAKY